MLSNKISIVKISVLFSIFFTYLFSAFLLAFILTSCTDNKPTVRISAALPLLWSSSYAGEELRDGLLMAAEEINEQGGINGHKIEIIVKNALSADGKISDSHAQKLFEELERDDPLIILSCLSFVSMKLATIAESKKRLLAGLVATVPELTQNREWVYRYWTTAEHEAPPMADIFITIREQADKDLNAYINTGRVAAKKGLGIIYLDDAYGSSVFADLAKRSKDNNIETVPSPFPSDKKDFADNVDYIKDTKAVVVIGFDFHITNILKALRSAQYKGEIISTTTATIPSITSMREADGVHVTAPALYNKNYPFADKVKRRYEEKHGKPFTQYSATGYDFIKILIGLLEDKPLTQESVKAAFDKGFVYSGVFGNIELKKGSHDILFPLFPAQIINGEIIYR
ncbi:MAG: ABC transporter substrate-binding protein [Desulfamplus sp.]